MAVKKVIILHIKINAKYPPRVIDGNGKVVGYLTINKNNSNRLKGSVADLICDKRDMVLKDGVER